MLLLSAGALTKPFCAYPVTPTLHTRQPQAIQRSQQNPNRRRGSQPQGRMNRVGDITVNNQVIAAGFHPSIGTLWFHSRVVLEAINSIATGAYAPRAQIHRWAGRINTALPVGFKMRRV